MAQVVIASKGYFPTGKNPNARGSSRFHLVRAMNILNPDYFDAATLGRIVGHLAASVEEGGLLVTGSNQGPDSPVDGSLFRRSGGGFREVFACGGGSPVRALVAAA